MASRPAENTAPPPPYPGRRNGPGTAALVIGVVSLVLAVLVIFAPLSLLLGIIAAILGGIGMSRASKGEADNRSHAVAGLVTGLLSIIVAIAIGISFANFITDHQSDLRRFGTCMTSADNDTERAPCVRRLGDALDEND
ncbi:MAG: DUF4190 domain-containing protein [Actinomycetota bacterium]